jgi:hypothetical protein
MDDSTLKGKEEPEMDRAWGPGDCVEQKPVTPDSCTELPSG